MTCQRAGRLPAGKATGHRCAGQPDLLDRMAELAELERRAVPHDRGSA